MYITNTTFIIEPHAHSMWIDVMKNKFIPLLENNGYKVAEFCRVLSAQAEDHFTYSLQVGLNDTGEYRKFTEEMLGEWSDIAGPMFGSSVLLFNTFMKRITL